MNDEGVVIVGRGRLGLSLVRALEPLGVAASALPGRVFTTDPEALATLRGAGTILLTVRDAAVTAVAAKLADAGVGGGQVVLHTSGLLTHEALIPLRAGGASLGSWHPLMTFRDPAGSPDLLAGAPAILEGDPTAVERGRLLATRLGMAPIVEIAGEEKPRYHAAAVIASNYLVVLAGLADALTRESALGDHPGLFTPLMARTLEHLAGGTPAAALTGPVVRGDVGTVAAHLAVLDEATADLYRRLGLEALRLSGADGEAALAMRAVLGRDEGG
jgi:predicted short-subunit dehydrogenase-like oxidoreductase (DUF2520 family)